MTAVKGLGSDVSEVGVSEYELVVVRKVFLFLDHGGS